MGRFFIYVLSCSATIKPWLRRTLVRSAHYSAISLFNFEITFLTEDCHPEARRVYTPGVQMPAA